MRSVDTFFRGHRRETIIDGAAILCNAAGEKRTKLNMKIPLGGDQLVGMPSWVSEPFSDISKPEYAVKSIASTMELDPMILKVYGLPEDQPNLDDRVLITFDGVRMCSFKIERDGDADKEHPDIVLTFTAYLPRTGKLLKFADDNFGSSLFILYEAAQQSLLDDNPNIKPTDEGDDDKDDDDDEAARREATSPAHDAEFAPVNGKKGKPKPVGQKRDGFGKPVAAARVQ